MFSSSKIEEWVKLLVLEQAEKVVYPPEGGRQEKGRKREREAARVKLFFLSANERQNWVMVEQKYGSREREKSFVCLAKVIRLTISKHIRDSKPFSLASNDGSLSKGLDLHWVKNPCARRMMLKYFSTPFYRVIS